jgi:hypothetical protein
MKAAHKKPKKHPVAHDHEFKRVIRLFGALGQEIAPRLRSDVGCQPGGSAAEPVMTTITET